MSGLTFVTTALKRVNKGGGFNPKTQKKDTGTDYIIFKCPSCSQRNNQSLYEAIYSTPEQSVAFKCRQCRATIEVNLPISDRVGSLIITPEEFNRRKQENRKIIHGH